MMGCLNLFFHKQVYLTNDLYFYYQQAVQELVAGRKDPIGFIGYWLFDWEHMLDHLNFFQKENMVYWSTLGTLIHTKLMTLFTVLTLGREYLNILFYNFLFILGQIAFYKTLYAYFPQKKNVLLWSIFFIPSVLFWCSGIHKDGLVFSVSGGIVYYLHLISENKQYKVMPKLIFLIFLLLCIRYFYFLCLLPALVLFLLSNRKEHKLRFYVLGYSLCALIFFFSKQISGFNPMKLVINKQAEYFQAKGYSDMETPLLTDNVGSFVQNLPTALNHVWLRPYPNPSDRFKYFVHGLDAWLVVALMLLSLMYFKQSNWKNSLLLFITFYCVSILLFIGYTIPNCGAVVRYRSCFMAMLLPVLLVTSAIPWHKLSGLQKRFRLPT